MKDIKPDDYIVFDAKDKVLGRVASAVAKELLFGKKVAIINAENARISGSKKKIIEIYKTRLNIPEKANPEHSPYWSRRSDMLFKRIVRGMLPYRKPRGKSAYRNLRVFMGTPIAFEKSKKVEIKTRDIKDMYVNTMTLGDLSASLGYNKT